MPAKPILNVRLAPETLHKLDAVAAATRRTRSFIANEALEAWIDREIEILEDLQVGLEEGRAGKGIPHEKAMRQIDGAIERASKRNGRRKAARK
ncbi:MAG TPA: CopG family transcriptional regulator [Reyranella sp.]